LRLPPSMSRLHPVFNVVKLTPAPDDPIEGRQPRPPPPPEIIDGEEEWIVEKILDSKVMNRKLRYLVKWEGFGIEHNSWEPWDNVNAPQLVTEFHQRHPGAARRIRTADFNALLFRPTVEVPSRHSLEGGVDVRGHPIHAPILPLQTRARFHAPISPPQISARLNCNDRNTSPILPLQMGACFNCNDGNSAPILPLQMGARFNCNDRKTSPILPLQIGARFDCNDGNSSPILPLQMGARFNCNDRNSSPILPLQMGARFSHKNVEPHFQSAGLYVPPHRWSMP